MNINLTKTTIEIDNNLLYRAKKIALEEKKSLKEIFEESLRRFLENPVTFRENLTDIEKRRNALMKLAGAWAGKDGEIIEKAAKKMRKTAKIISGKRWFD